MDVQIYKRGLCYNFFAGKIWKEKLHFLASKLIKWWGAWKYCHYSLSSKLLLHQQFNWKIVLYFFMMQKKTGQCLFFKKFYLMQLYCMSFISTLKSAQERSTSMNRAVFLQSGLPDKNICWWWWLTEGSCILINKILHFSFHNLQPIIYFQISDKNRKLNEAV